jgi:hypothetical protein
MLRPSALGKSSVRVEDGRERQCSASGKGTDAVVYLLRVTKAQACVFLALRPGQS